jgi:class 3 adenylate cyclase
MGFGVGLAMGQATVGRIGNESRSDYTAIGSVVNLASRLCSSAADGEILLDATAYEAVADRRPVTPQGLQMVKGYDEALPVFAAARGDQNRAA